MKAMKKISAVLGIIIAFASFAGCKDGGSSNGTGSGNENKPPVQAVEKVIDLAGQTSMDKTVEKANQLAVQLRETFEQLQIPFLVSSPTNQLFPILPDAVFEELSKKYCFIDMERVDETHRCTRFCTSWATKQENVDALCADLCRIYAKA